MPLNNNEKLYEYIHNPDYAIFPGADAAVIPFNPNKFSVYIGASISESLVYGNDITTAMMQPLDNAKVAVEYIAHGVDKNVKLQRTIEVLEKTTAINVMAQASRVSLAASGAISNQIAREMKMKVLYDKYLLAKNSQNVIFRGKVMNYKEFVFQKSLNNLNRQLLIQKSALPQYKTNSARVESRVTVSIGNIKIGGDNNKITNRSPLSPSVGNIGKPFGLFNRGAFIGVTRRDDSFSYIEQNTSRFESYHERDFNYEVDFLMFFVLLMLFLYTKVKFSYLRRLKLYNENESIQYKRKDYFELYCLDL